MRTLVLGLGFSGAGLVQAVKKPRRNKAIGMPVLFDLPAL
jgi:hypothetical protein